LYYLFILNYIYIYIERERERERGESVRNLHVETINTSLKLERESELVQVRISWLNENDGAD
jgi:hypothetical protein